MSAGLIISIFLLVAASYIIFRAKRRPSPQETGGAFPPPRSLFGPHHDAAPSLSLSGSKAAAASEHAAELWRRARSGDKAALRDAHASGDVGLYHQTLDALVARAGDSAGATWALASYISDSNQLRANANLAESVMKFWKAAPDRASTARMLHVAALSGDALMFEKAIEVALRCWREGRLPQLTGDDLYALVESEYWVLAPEAVRSGNSFTLKRTLAEMRRQLKANSRRALFNAEPDR